ncbi:MAG: GxxExxY protein [Acidobacteria bacterium]|nr:GxxExxY protein [Acidobacteriota bacterium]MBK8812120.1 GxxExxY protein [Acidobacteriota bacterium]
MLTEKVLYPELSYRIVGLAMQVHRELGYGFLEKVYENSLMVLLRQNSIEAEQSVDIKVRFQGVIVGDYESDIIVDRKIILELKSAKSISGAHRAQTLNYLKATGFRLGILLNFGQNGLESERLIF